MSQVGDMTLKKVCAACLCMSLRGLKGTLHLGAKILDVRLRECCVG